MARGASSDGVGSGSAHNTPAEDNENTQVTSDTGSKDQTQESGDVAMAEADPEHRRTDHERQEPPTCAPNVLYKVSTARKYLPARLTVQC